jgi:hypothetical protein
LNSQSSFFWVVLSYPIFFVGFTPFHDDRNTLKPEEIDKLKDEVTSPEKALSTDISELVKK